LPPLQRKIIKLRFKLLNFFAFFALFALFAFKVLKIFKREKSEKLCNGGSMLM